MTATLGNLFSATRPTGGNVLFAEDSDKDLDFDEGFEEDELHQSKPPSRRPLMWILILLLLAGVAYWVLNNPTGQMGNSGSMNAGTDSYSASTAETIQSPLFSEDQLVVLVEKAVLMGDPANTLPGPLVQAGDQLTILDGSYESQGWVYLVKTTTGKTGWIPGEKLKSQS